MKKIISVIICVSVFCCCLPFLASADEVELYSNLPEPKNTDTVRYFVVDLNGAITLYQVSHIIGITDILFYVESNILTIQVVTGDGGISPIALQYNLYTGSVRSAASKFGSRVGSSNTFEYRFSNFPTNTNTVRVNTMNQPVGTSFNLNPIPIAWSDATDPYTYEYWLNRIYSKLNEVDTNTDGIESTLSSINSELNLFYSVFNSYQGEILADMTIIESQLDDIHDKLDTFSIQNHDDLMDIYDKLDDIYDLLNEEASTYAPVEQEQQINDYVQAEEALNKDYSGDLQNQFDVAGNVFENNNAFSFLSVMFQRVVLNNTKINGLVIFALALGLCVLVLGRKINA